MVGLVFLILANNVFIQVAFNFKDITKSFLSDEISNPPDLNIIFTETNSTRKFMSFKELCAIESAAKNNPESTVLVLSINAVIKEQDLLEKYKNIKLKLVKLNDTFYNTTLHDWWFSKKLDTAKDPYYHISHLSDALRFTFLFKYGGVYSDLDTITIKNYQFLRKFNGFGTSYEASDIQAGVLHFTKEHPFIRKCLESFAKNYDGRVWAANGPLLLAKVINSYCNQSNYTSLLFFDNILPAASVELKQNHIDCDVGIFPFYIFYPYRWSEWKVLFEKNTKLLVNKFLNTYSVHFYGKMSGGEMVKVNENSLIEFFASTNCPLTYSKYVLMEKN